MSKHHESNAQTTDVIADRKPDPPAGPPILPVRAAAVVRFFRDPTTGNLMVERPVEGGQHSIVKVADDNDKQRNKVQLEKFEKESPTALDPGRSARQGRDAFSQPGSAPAARTREVEKHPSRDISAPRVGGELIPQEGARPPQNVASPRDADKTKAPTPSEGEVRARANVLAAFADNADNAEKTKPQTRFPAREPDKKPSRR